LATGDDSQLAHPGFKDNKMKETTAYKSMSIRGKKRQLAISPGR